MDFVEISELINDREYGLELEQLGEPKELSMRISEVRIHKLGLLLTCLKVKLHSARIQVLGRTENIYIKHLDPGQRTETANILIERGVKCIVITRMTKVPKQFTNQLLDAGVCVLRTPLASDEFIERATNFLTNRLAPRLSIHGVLIDVLGVGVLLVGKGGIGKSECALDLVHRGHRLVADDLVELVRWRDYIVGYCSQLIRHHMEIRGLGIINIQDLYGIASVRDKKRVDLVVELAEWSPKLKLDPLGVDDDVYIILGVELPHIKLPVLPGKNLSVIVEVAARNHLLKKGGHDSAKEFQEMLSREIAAVESVAVFPGEEVE